jgi:integrase/recombinase XerD
VVGEVRLRVIEGQVVPDVGAVDPERFQAGCVEAFVASWTVRAVVTAYLADHVDTTRLPNV